MSGELIIKLNYLMLGMKSVGKLGAVLNSLSIQIQTLYGVFTKILCAKQQLFKFWLNYNCNAPYTPQEKRIPLVFNMEVFMLNGSSLDNV